MIEFKEMSENEEKASRKKIEKKASKRSKFLFEFGDKEEMVSGSSWPK